MRRLANINGSRKNEKLHICLETCETVFSGAIGENVTNNQSLLKRKSIPEATELDTFGRDNPYTKLVLQKKQPQVVRWHEGRQLELWGWTLRRHKSKA